MIVNSERLHRLGKEDSPNCTRCGKLDDRCHLLRCEFNKEVNRGVIKLIEEVTGGPVGDNRLGVLDLQAPSALQLPLMYLLSETILSLQVHKQKDRYLKVENFKAEISAKVKIFSESKKFTQAEVIVNGWLVEYFTPISNRSGEQ